jgi:hypothetical protein
MPSSFISNDNDIKDLLQTHKMFLELEVNILIKQNVHTDNESNDVNLDNININCDSKSINSTDGLIEEDIIIDENEIFKNKENVLRDSLDFEEDKEFETLKHELESLLGKKLMDKVYKIICVNVFLSLCF